MDTPETIAVIVGATMPSNDHTIEQIEHAITTCKMTNTYKMAWLRAIIDHTVENTEDRTIDFDSLAERIFNDYKIKSKAPREGDVSHGSNPATVPGIVQIVRSVDNPTDKDIKKISSILKKDVAWRFLNDVDLYDLDLQARTITLHDPQLLRDNAERLTTALVKRRACVLNQWNPGLNLAEAQ
tara:strand:+ start:579 stop:1127 length:549 start_codon:yes stop_codon:yes gene_type:complete